MDLTTDPAPFPSSFEVLANEIIQTAPYDAETAMRWEAFVEGSETPARGAAPSG